MMTSQHTGMSTEYPFSLRTKLEWGHWLLNHRQNASDFVLFWSDKIWVLTCIYQWFVSSSTQHVSIYCKSFVLLASWWKEELACLSLFLCVPWICLVLDKAQTWDSVYVGGSLFLLECTPTNPKSVQEHWSSEWLSQNDGPEGKQK